MGITAIFGQDSSTADLDVLAVRPAGIIQDEVTNEAPTEAEFRRSPRGRWAEDGEMFDSVVEWFRAGRTAHGANIEVPLSDATLGIGVALRDPDAPLSTRRYWFEVLLAPRAKS